MSGKKRETLGKIASDLSQKQLYSNDAIETARAIMTESPEGDGKSYKENFDECIETGKTKFDRPFYIEIIGRQNKNFPNVWTNHFSSLNQCPHPLFCQDVYVFDPSSEKLELLWSIPVQQWCEFFYHNPLEVPPEKKQLLGYILDLYDGTLRQLSDDRNRKQNAPKIII